MRVIACSMLQDEVNLAIKQTNADVTVVWLDKGMHESPERLRRELQTRIDCAKEGEVLLLCFCQCGNGTVGLKANRAPLILINRPDCTHMLLKDPKSRCNNCLYFTQGWIESEGFIGREYRRMAKLYGEDTAREVYSDMLKHYDSIKLIDTSAYDIDKIYKEALSTAELFRLDLSVEKGTIHILKKLFLKEWDKDFIRVFPGETVTQEQFSPAIQKDRDDISNTL